MRRVRTVGQLKVWAECSRTTGHRAQSAHAPLATPCHSQLLRVVAARWGTKADHSRAVQYPPTAQNGMCRPGWLEWTWLDWTGTRPCCLGCQRRSIPPTPDGWVPGEAARGRGRRHAAGGGDRASTFQKQGDALGLRASVLRGCSAARLQRGSPRPAPRRSPSPDLVGEAGGGARSHASRPVADGAAMAPTSSSAP